jgi:chromosome segregation ATPase
MIDNTEKVLDSRDIIARIEELIEIRDAVDEAQAAFDEAREELTTANVEAGELPEDNEQAADDVERAEKALDDAEDVLTAAKDEYEDIREELEMLEALAEEGEQYSEDWKYGATLIRENYFTDYCKELCEDIGDIPKDLPPYIVIDWDTTAENLKVDYTTIDFGTETFYVR